jgi:hypothetical protein
MDGQTTHMPEFTLACFDMGLIDADGSDGQISGYYTMGLMGMPYTGLQYTWTAAAIPEDADGDGVPDSEDNCPAVANPGQADVDGDGIGDACDPCTDVDNDGYCAETDDCDDTDASINPGATEICGDGIDQDCSGADLECNADDDGDGIPNLEDNCPAVANPDQTDTDGDGIGDVCDPCTDVDNDGYCAETDDCNDNDDTINPGATEICGDGIDQDCSGSDLACEGQTIIINGCDTGVEDAVYKGQLISQWIHECAAGAMKHGKFVHGQFVSCVTRLTNKLVRDGVITSAERRAIKRCIKNSHRWCIKNSHRCNLRHKNHKN